MKYDYEKEMYGDIEEYIEREFGLAILCEMSKEDAYEKLYDELWVEDSVTGNASGSYTFSTYQAEEYLCHNMELWYEACEEFGDEKPKWNGAEYADVTIRCYLLGSVLTKVLDDIYEDLDENEDYHESEDENDD